MGQSKGGRTKTEHNKSVEISQQNRVNDVLNAFTERRNAIDQV
jgi:hypothetical protein